VKKYRNPIDIFKSVEQQMSAQENKFDWQEIFELFHKPDVIRNPEIIFPKFDYDRIKEVLLEHDFSQDRIDSGLEKLKESKEKSKQRTLF